MKRVDFKKQSPVFYIGKGLIIASVVITTSLGFLLGFFVGKQVHPLQENRSAGTVPLKEPAQTPQEPETAQVAAPEQPGKNVQPSRDQQIAESRSENPTEKPPGNLRDTGPSSADRQHEQPRSPVTPKTKQAQVANSAQGSPEKKNTDGTQDKIPPPKTPSARKYTVQVGAFKNPEEADALRTSMSKKGYKVFVIPTKTKKQELLHKVMVGEYKTRKEAEVLSIKLKNSEGLRTFVTFVTQEGAPRQQ
jgi:cell division septation protein DedD